MKINIPVLGLLCMLIFALLGMLFAPRDLTDIELYITIITEFTLLIFAIRSINK